MYTLTETETETAIDKMTTVPNGVFPILNLIQLIR